MKTTLVTTTLVMLALGATLAIAQAATPKGRTTAEKPAPGAAPGVCDGAGPHGAGMGMGPGGPHGMGMGPGGGHGAGMRCGKGAGMRCGKGAGMGCGKGAGMACGKGAGIACGKGGGRMGHGPGMGMGMGMLAGLDLTEAQREKVAAIHERAARTNIQSRADLQIAQMDLRKLMHADKPDSRAIEAQIDKVAGLRASMQKAHAATMLEVHGLLTPEQLKKVKSMGGACGHPGMGPGMGCGHGPGMGMGFDPEDDGPEDGGLEG